jgi:HSP20 family protein
MRAIERYRRRFPGHRIHLFGPSTVRDEVRRLFKEFSPDVDIILSENCVKVKIELPDTRKEDLDISLRNNLLIVKGEKRSELVENGDQKYYVERRFGSFSRTLELPAHVRCADARASLKNGVLEIVLHKIEEEEHKDKKIFLD